MYRAMANNVQLSEGVKLGAILGELLRSWTMGNLGEEKQVAILNREGDCVAVLTQEQCWQEGGAYAIVRLDDERRSARYECGPMTVLHRPQD